MSPGAIAAVNSAATTSRVLIQARPARNVVMQKTKSAESHFPPQDRQLVPSRLETSRWSRFVEGGGLGRITVNAGVIHEQ